jgi:hypothetical protein
VCNKYLLWFMKRRFSLPVLKVPITAAPSSSLKRLRHVYRQNRRLIAEAWFNIRGICGGQGGPGTDFPPKLLFSPVSKIPPLLHIHLFAYTVYIYIFFSQQPPVGHGLFIHEVSRSHNAVSCAVPMRNVSWMLFQEGRSSNFS